MAYNQEWYTKDREASVKVMKCHIRGYVHIAGNFESNVQANAKWCGIDAKEIAIVFGEKRQRLTLDLNFPGSQKFAEATKALGIIETSEFHSHSLVNRFQQLALDEMGMSTLPSLGL
jgi:hypothetical protein